MLTSTVYAVNESYTFKSRGKIVIDNGTSDTSDDVIFDSSDLNTMADVVKDGKSEVAAALNNKFGTTVSGDSTFNELSSTINNLPAQNAVSVSLNPGDAIELPIGYYADNSKVSVPEMTKTKSALLSKGVDTDTAKLSDQEVADAISDIKTTIEYNKHYHTLPNGQVLTDSSVNPEAAQSGKGGCYTTENKIYHVHTGNINNGTGCYTGENKHSHTDDCYHIHKGDSENGGACYTYDAGHIHDVNCYEDKAGVLIDRIFDDSIMHSETSIQYKTEYTVEYSDCYSITVRLSRSTSDASQYIQVDKFADELSLSMQRNNGESNEWYRETSQIIECNDQYVEWHTQKFMANKGDVITLNRPDYINTLPLYGSMHYYITLETHFLKDSRDLERDPSFVLSCPYKDYNSSERVLENMDCGFITGQIENYYLNCNFKYYTSGQPVDGNIEYKEYTPSCGKLNGQILSAYLK